MNIDEKPFGGHHLHGDLCPEAGSPMNTARDLFFKSFPCSSCSKCILLLGNMLHRCLMLM